MAPGRSLWVVVLFVPARRPRPPRAVGETGAAPVARADWRRRSMSEKVITPEAAGARLHRVARGVTDASEPEAVSRFLERLSADPDAEELRAALVLAGAAAVLREARP